MSQARYEVVSRLPVGDNGLMLTDDLSDARFFREHKIRHGYAAVLVDTETGTVEGPEWMVVDYLRRSQELLPEEPIGEGVGVYVTTSDQSRPGSG